MKKRRNKYSEENTPFSIQDDRQEQKTETVRKERIKHKRGPRKRKEKKTMSKSTKKKIAITVGSVVGVLAVGYLGGAAFFNGHFYLNTSINGNDFSGKSVKQAEKYLKDQVADYKLTLKEINNGTESISGKDIAVSYKPGNELEKIKKEQNPFLWPVSLWKESKVDAKINVEYDTEKLETVMSQLQCMKAENQTAPQNAQPKYDGNQFVVQAEVKGTQIHPEGFKKAVDESIRGLHQELDMAASGCYNEPKYTSESKEVLNAAEEMNKALNSKITYDLSPKTEVVDKTLISQWLTVNENMEVTFDTQKVNAYIAQLATKYNTVGTTRRFVTGRGDTVNVSGGDFGWYLNQKDEYAALTANIKSGEEVSREPKWSRRGAEHGDMNDYGNTYAEVDLTTQRFWFFQDGKAIMNCDIVTGKPNGEDDTPQGSYDLTYKTKNAVLRGQRLPNGEYSYESPVAFWMPFNGDIGFHDASWQTRFGGDWYKTHGSHGCINMKYDDAKKLYDLINETTPIICHF
nr:peptidoglycan binding domain-containing protein [uncultured Sellimonas sp.]